MVDIFSDWKRYNANSRNNNVGDCVKRALSIAYSIDYDEVSKELNQIKRQVGASDYSENIVMDRYMLRRGDKFQYSIEDVNFKSEQVTADEFCRRFNSGVYLLALGKHKGAATHAAAVVDGDLYDSWDSRTWIVDQASVVKQGTSTMYAVGYKDIQEDLEQFISNYVEVLNQKCAEWMVLSVMRYTYTPDQYTCEKNIKCKLIKVPRRCWKWHTGTSLTYELVFKLNPRLSLEQNVITLKKKCKQKLYDWMYNVRKELQDAALLDSIQVNPKFHGDDILLTKLPEWARGQVIGAYDNGSSSSWSRYSVVMLADVEDPRADVDPTVTFEGSTLTEIKRQMNLYHESFQRYYYDY